MEKMDLKKFLSKKNKTVHNKQPNMNDIDKDSVTNMKKTVSEYSSKSEDELLDELKRVADENRQSGELDNEKLDGFANQVAPMLDEEQRKKMEQLISMLKQ